MTTRAVNSREKILQSVRRHKPDPVDRPEELTISQTALDLEDRFTFHLDSIGGVARFFDSREEALNALPGVEGGQKMRDLVRGTFNVDVGEEPEVTIIEARWAVAENGAVFITDMEVPERVHLFLGQKLIALVPRDSILINMHDAYKAIDLLSVGFGIFIAGPSATADIAQILVRGAHGPSEMEVWLFN